VAEAASREAEALRRPAAEPHPAAPERPPLIDGVLALQASAGNAAVNRLLARRPRPRLDTSAPAAPAAAPPAPMTRDRFDHVMHTRFGVRDVRNGVAADQAGGHAPGWTAWDPDVATGIYDAIAGAFEDVDNAMGGLPHVNEIVFMAVDYDWVAATRTWVASSDVGASYGAGRLNIFRALTTRSKGLPVARSTRAGRYPTVVFGLEEEGASPGAPLPLPARAMSMRRLVAHELGHGIAEAAMGPTPDRAPDPQMMDDWRKAAGWTAGRSPELFDVSDAAVRTALAAGTRPSASPILPTDWNSPQWGEQPISHYSVTGGPGEDFAESTMAFVLEPALLQARSPSRYRFLDEHRWLWQKGLRQTQRAGDFPIPRGETRVG
jgi:hypothetical protein